MAEATSIEFYTLYNNTLPLKPSSSQVDKKQVSRHFRVFLLRWAPRWYYQAGGRQGTGWRARGL